MPTGPRPLTPNVVECTMGFLQDGQYCYNTHHYYSAAGWDVGRMENIGTFLREWWQTNIRPLAAMTVQLNTIVVRDLSERNGREVTVQTGLPISGDHQSPAMPNNVTIAIKKGTGLSGRSFRGRTYFVGLTEGECTGNNVLLGVQVALQAAFDLLRDPFGALDDTPLVVLSEVTGGFWRNEGIATPVTGIGVDPILDSQRRRLPGRGR